jgi:hypothetical protein
MNYWRALIRFLVGVLGGIVFVLAIFEWGVKLKVSRWVIPDWILLALIVLLLAVAAHTAYWVHRYGQGDGRHGGRRKARLKPNKEHMFILSALADCCGRSARRTYLTDCYLAVFNQKMITDFNLVFQALRQRNYIAICSYGSDDICSMTGDGFAFFEKHRTNFEKKDGGIPPVPADIKEEYRLAEDF